jgi:uncharacterized protein (DUF1330 family)
MKKSILICILFISALALFSNKAVAQENDTQRTVLVINAIVDQEQIQELQGYLSQMMQIFKEHGGKPIGRYKTIEKIRGPKAPEMIAMISFENEVTIKSMFEGDEYKSLSELRERVFSDLTVVICTELN